MRLESFYACGSAKAMRAQTIGTDKLSSRTCRERGHHREPMDGSEECLFYTMCYKSPRAHLVDGQRLHNGSYSTDAKHIGHQLLYIIALKIPH